ncbi:MAG: VOC family protein [Lachnospiraceae bacterium]|jgi:methylmalonyl-CoA/ethylmalonyl-CoA epimerase|nr:VOC family protein [Lachnospiraceae bacterium]
MMLMDVGDAHMLNLKVHHVGYLVKKSAPAKEAFLSLGWRTEQDFVRDDARGIDICFLIKDGLRIELICPFRSDSTVSGLLKRIPNGPYHICYLSRSLEQDGSTLRDLGFLPIGDPAPAPACGGHPVQFFIHPAMGMIELLGEDA